jgi:poly(hydroxyalkanoate) depolymerase family esterase
MRSLSDTISRLSRSRLTPAAAPVGTGKLTELRNFGSNPGALRGWVHVPKDLPPGSPLVVVLHGCTQSADAYDHGAGWSAMADRHGFAVLFPEQQRQNNPNLCFNWFLAADTARGSGEALSVRQMAASVTASSAIDPARIFVTGLSAGGAMAAAMLAAYPDVFAGGAIIAGLPSGSATTIPEAFDRMRGHGIPADAELAAGVRRASEFQGPWPTLSVWHGTADRTVHPVNGDAIVAQWLAVHEVAKAPSATERLGAHTRRVWRNAEGRSVIEHIALASMGHGTPLKTTGPDSCGAPGPFMLETGLSSTHEICRFWGLLEVARQSAVSDTPRTSNERSIVPALIDAPRIAAKPILQRIPMPMAGKDRGVREVIEDALRKAGLMP